MTADPMPACGTVGVFAIRSRGPGCPARRDRPDCTRCKLHTLGRKQVVFGVGNPNADLMFVGEAPGADEDIQGEPFVGRAGQLLTKIIEAIGLTREDVYIANVIKCRPPGNRNPEPDEVEQCEPFLFRQIDTIKPKVDRRARQVRGAVRCCKTTEPISRLRGREFTYRDAILMPTFHPAYLLRNPSAKREVWEDMKRVRAILAGAKRDAVAFRLPFSFRRRSAFRSSTSLTYRVPARMPARRRSARACACRSARARRHRLRRRRTTAALDVRQRRDERQGHRRGPRPASRSCRRTSSSCAAGSPTTTWPGSAMRWRWRCRRARARGRPAFKTPPRRAADRPRSDGDQASMRRVAAITAHGTREAPTASVAGVDLTRSSGALDVLAARPPALPLSELRDRGVTADVLGRLAARGLVVDPRRRPTSAIRSSARRWPTWRRDADAAADRRAGGGVRAAGGARRRGRLPRGAAARRDRQRQDRDLPAPGRARLRQPAGRCCCWCPRSR